MKVFIYSKVTNKRIAVIKDVVEVHSIGNDKICFITEQSEKFTFDTHEMKTTTYQN